LGALVDRAKNLVDVVFRFVDTRRDGVINEVEDIKGGTKSAALSHLTEVTV